MAVTFSKEISVTEILNAYNNNVVEFTSDVIPGGETISKAVINIGGFDFEITPILNVLRFNFKEVVTVLLSNNFDDDVIADADIKADTSLTNSFLTTYTITFSDDTTENTNLTYVFVKSVEQIANVSTRLLTEQQILTPKELTFFKGFPFDIGHYSDGNITIFNNKLGVNNVLTETATDTFRLFLLNKRSQFRNRVIADGGIYEENICWLEGFNYELLETGFNTLDIQGTTSEILTINLKDVCDGTYLKWFNREGAWSYWLFNPIFKEIKKTKTLDVFNVDFESIGDTVKTELITGKTSSPVRDLIYEKLTESERLQINTVFDSPRVEMYNGEQGEILSTWQSVRVLDGSLKTIDTKRAISNIKLKIFINDYTQA